MNARCGAGELMREEIIKKNLFVIKNVEYKIKMVDVYVYIGNVVLKNK